MSAQRRGQVGGGGRTEKIRTYNFKENRVTDHRINLTLYKLDQVLAGDLDELTDALMADKRARQLGGEEGRRGGRRPVTVAAGRRRRALVAELAGSLGAPHEARFIVDEALGLGLGLGPGRPRPTGPLAASGWRRPAPWRRGGRRGSRCSTSSATGPSASSTSWSTPACSIPRPETEQVVEVALAEARRLRRGARARGCVRGRRRHRVRRHRPLAGGRAGRRRAAPRSGPPTPAPARSPWRRPTWTRAGAPRRRAPAPGGAGRRQLAGPAAAPAARPGRPGRRQPARTWPRTSGPSWRRRCGPSRAGARGRAGQRRHAGLADVEAVLVQSRRWLGRPGAVVVELAPHQADAGDGAGPAPRVRRRPGRARPGRAARGRWWRGPTLRSVENGRHGRRRGPPAARDGCGDGRGSWRPWGRAGHRRARRGRLLPGRACRLARASRRGWRTWPPTPRAPTTPSAMPRPCARSRRAGTTS